MLVIAVIALIVIGPRKLPELMRTVGKLMGQLRRASDDLRREILFSEEINEVRDAINPFAPPPVPPPLRTRASTPPLPEDSPQDAVPLPHNNTPESSSREDKPDGD